MKRSKRLLVLLGCLAALCVGTVLLSQMEESREQIKNTGEIVLALSADEVQSLRWEHGDTTLAFHRDGDWQYDEDAAFPVDGEKLDDLLDIFASFGVSFVIEDVTDFGMYGLDDPACVIQLSTQENTYTVELGDYSKMDQERYVSIGDGNVYLAKVDPLDSFAVERDDLLRHDESLSYDQVTQLRFDGQERYTIFREEDSAHAWCGEDVYFTEREGETLPLDSDRVDAYLSTLSRLRLTDYVTYHATEEELASCGLTEPELTITVDYADKDGGSGTYVLSVSRDPEELAAAEKAEADGKEAEEVTAYVRVGDSPLVYRVSADNGENLLAASWQQLRHREVLVADFADVNRIDVTLEGEDYTLLAEGRDKDDARIWNYGGEEVSISALQTELEALEVEYSDDFTDDRPTGKREIALTVYLDREERPEVRIELYRQDGEHCLALVDGEPLALVPRKDAVDVIEAVNSIVLR